MESNDRFKFRAWDPIIEMWANSCIQWNARKGGFECQKYWVFEQCTGLKDKNSKLIWEGDIVVYDRELFRVSWLGSAWTLEDITDCGCDELFCYVDTHELDVIGNIHDNGDLLNV